MALRMVTWIDRGSLIEQLAVENVYVRLGEHSLGCDGGGHGDVHA